MIIKDDISSKIIVKKNKGVKRVVKTFKNDVSWFNSDWVTNITRITEMNPNIFPQIYSIDIAKKQMTMEHIDGNSMEHIQNFTWNDYEKHAFSVFLNECVLAMINYSMKYENFIHLDFHPGNIIRKNDQFKLVDLDSFVMSRNQIEFSFHLGKLYNKLSNITYDFCYRSLKDQIDFYK